MYHTLASTLCACLALFASTLSVTAIAQAEQPPTADIPDTIQSAVLNEEWQKVADLITDDLCNRSPVARLLKGHACLAINRNNESFCLFYTSRDASDLEAWRAWTTSFLASNPQKTAPHYLAGDAQSRIADWPAAIDSFTKGLAVNPNHSLILNGRGVAYAASSNLPKAAADFAKAISTNRNLADAYCNYGFGLMQGKSGTKSACKHFDKALARCSDFGLAFLGRASANIAAGALETTVDDMQRATEALQCSPDLVAGHAKAVASYITGAGNTELACLSDEDVGMSLQTSFTDLVSNPSQGTLNAFVSKLGSASADVNDKYTDLYTTTVQADPVFAAITAPLVANGVLWNAEGGAAQRWNSLWGADLGVDVGKGGITIEPGTASLDTANVVQQTNSATFLELDSAYSYDSHDSAVGGVKTHKRPRTEDKKAFLPPTYGLCYIVALTPVLGE